jgi:antirestriction protein ArdC
MFGRHRASRFQKQALELGAHVRKGEAGELVVYADSITRTETDAKGEETERDRTGNPLS